LGNTMPTGAILAVLITMLAPICGAHFNTAVTLAFRLRKEISGVESASCSRYSRRCALAKRQLVWRSDSISRRRTGLRPRRHSPIRW
jgi:hypothetical protein